MHREASDTVDTRGTDEAVGQKMYGSHNCPGVRRCF